MNNADKWDVDNLRTALHVEPDEVRWIVMIVLAEREQRRKEMERFLEEYAMTLEEQEEYDADRVLAWARLRQLCPQVRP